MAWKVVGPEEVSLGATGAYHAMALAWVQKKFNETHMVLQLEEGIEGHCARSFLGQGLGLATRISLEPLCHHAVAQKAVVPDTSPFKPLFPQRTGIDRHGQTKL